MVIIEEIIAIGHPNISATHRSTIEITKEKNLTRRGNCIIGISANKALPDLSQNFKENIKSNLKITCFFIAHGITEEISGYGHPLLTFSHPTDIVIRKSKYICPRTLMIGANKSAKDLDRKLIQLLKSSQTQLKVRLIIEI